MYSIYSRLFGNYIQSCLFAQLNCQFLVNYILGGQEGTVQENEKIGHEKSGRLKTQDREKRGTKAMILRLHRHFKIGWHLCVQSFQERRRSL